MAEFRDIIGQEQLKEHLQGAIAKTFAINSLPEFLSPLII